MLVVSKTPPILILILKPLSCLQVTIDPTCSYLACSFSNKSLCIYDIFTGEMVTQAMGHGEVITGVIFLPDCKHIVSVSVFYP